MWESLHRPANDSRTANDPQIGPQMILASPMIPGPEMVDGNVCTQEFGQWGYKNLAYNITDMQETTKASGPHSTTKHRLNLSRPLSKL